MSLARLAPIALLAIAAAAPAQKVTLRVKPATGKVYVYAMSVSSSSANAVANMSQTSTVTTKVVSNTGGKVTLSSSTSNVKVTVPPGSPMAKQVPQMQKSMATQNVKTVVDSRGKLLSAGTGENAMMKAMSEGIGGNMEFPAGPVGVGSSWTTTIDLAKMFGSAMPGMKVSGGKVPIKMTLVAFETRAGRKTAKIRTTMAGTVSLAMPSQGGAPAGSSKITLKSDGSTWIELASGMNVETVTTSTNSMNFGGNAFTQTTKMTMKLK